MFLKENNTILSFLVMPFASFKSKVLILTESTNSHLDVNLFKSTVAINVKQEN